MKPFLGLLIVILALGWTRALADSTNNTIQQHNNILKIVQIKVINLFGGTNNVEFWGVQEIFKNPYSSEGKLTSITHNSGIIMQESAGLGTAADYLMYFAVSGSSNAYAIYYPELKTYIISNSFEEKRNPIKSVRFFDALWNGHLQTFVAYASRESISVNPSKTEVMIFYYVPGFLVAGSKNSFVGPNFELLEKYETPYKCSNSDFVLKKEFSIPLPDEYYKNYHCIPTISSCDRC